MRNEGMISIIVTIYNKADSLNKCIDSIIAQSLLEIDIILVDDGSTDDSAKIIDYYKELDSRVQVIHKANGGETSARKEGLCNAKGEYVLFVDADDWIDSESLKYLSLKAQENNADVVTGDWVIHYGEFISIDAGYMPEGVYKKDYNKTEFVNHMIYYNDVKQTGVNASLNTKLFRKDLILKTISELPDGIVYAEDDFVSYATMALADIVVVTHMPFYHYVMVQNSISHSINIWYLRDLNQGYVYYKKAIKGTPLENACMRQIEIYMQRAVFYGMSKYLDFQDGSSVLWYRFDEGKLPEKSKIVIYGAGKVGKCYYRQLSKSKKITVIAWVDRQYSEYRKKGFNVDDVKIIHKLDFDYIVIAVADISVARSIRKYLAEFYVVNDQSIMWEEPINEYDEVMSSILNIDG